MLPKNEFGKLRMQYSIIKSLEKIIIIWDRFNGELPNSIEERVISDQINSNTNSNYSLDKISPSKDSDNLI